MKNVLNNRGFGIIESLVALAIMTAVTTGSFVVMDSGSESWSTTDTKMQLQENLRRTVERVSREVRESGTDKDGNIQVTINNGGGVNGTDIIRFSVPVVCEAGIGVMDANGDVANWGAPLTWGCTDASCMDADNDCGTLDYAAVEYRINANNQLVRRVVDAVNATVREDVFAHNIVDLQAVLNQNLVNPQLHERIVTLTLTGTQQTKKNRTITMTNANNIYLRNRGT